MHYLKYIDKYHRVDLYERKKNAQFSAIFGGGWQLKWRFSNFPRFRENYSASGPSNGIFENNSLWRLFGQNMKKSKISRLSSHSRYLRESALKKVRALK